MNFALFEKIGLNKIDFSFVIIGMLVVLVTVIVLLIVTFVKMSNLKKTYRRFMTGRTVKSLENEIVALFDDNKEMKEQISENKKAIRDINKRMRKVYQKAAIVRYDAFKEMGGKLSFCLALLNEDNDGFILNSVHSSAGCYSYMKEIRGGRCEIELGNEEQNALNEALGIGEL